MLAAGFQTHFALNSAGQYLPFAAGEDLQTLMPVFWIGFNLLMFPASAQVNPPGRLAVLAVAAALGAVATLRSSLAPSLA